MQNWSIYSFLYKFFAELGLCFMALKYLLWDHLIRRCWFIGHIRGQRPDSDPDPERNVYHASSFRTIITHITNHIKLWLDVALLCRKLPCGVTQWRLIFRARIVHKKISRIAQRRRCSKNPHLSVEHDVKPKSWKSSRLHCESVRYVFVYRLIYI